MVMGSRTRRVFCSLSLAACSLTLSACPDPGMAPAEPSIDFGGAEPQDSAIPPGNPDDDRLPQIVALRGPTQARLGQVVTLRISTDFEPVADIAGAAVVLDDLGVWFDLPVEPVVGAPSDAAKWIIELPATLVADAASGSEVPLRVALLGPTGEAGGYA